MTIESFNVMTGSSENPRRAYDCYNINPCMKYSDGLLERKDLMLAVDVYKCEAVKQ